LIWFSEEHDTKYSRMATELMRYGGHSGQIQDWLARVARRGGCASDHEALRLDRLYREYGDRDLIE
jgi:hypothetical protein